MKRVKLKFDRRKALHLVLVAVSSLTFPWHARAQQQRRDLKMQAFKVAGLNHTCFTVSNLDDTIRFFVECLGCELELRRPVPKVIEQLVGISGIEVEQAFLKGGGNRIELLCYKSPPDRKIISSRPIDVGSVHLGVYVDDAKAAVEKASAYGFALMGEFVEIDIAGQSSPIKAVAWTRNADGITVEFLEVH